jgi:hypothetical protein
MNTELNPCPICGKQPKVHRDINYEQNGYGAWITISCKPFLRKPHKIVECGKSTYERALLVAIKEWNGVL